MNRRDSRTKDCCTKRQADRPARIVVRKGTGECCFDVMVVWCGAEEERKVGASKNGSHMKWSGGHEVETWGAKMAVE